MARRSAWFSFRSILVLVPVLVALVPGVLAFAADGRSASTDAAVKAKIARIARFRVTQAQRQAAADRMAAMKATKRLTTLGGVAAPLVAPLASVAATPQPGGVPDYFGSTANWAYSPLIRKFVDTLPGLGASKANNLGHYLSVAHPDTTTYPGSDYYEIELRQYTQKLHSDLPETTLRGYVQVNYGTDSDGHNTIHPDDISYLGPTILASKGRPVRIKFTNKLPIGDGGDLFLPVDTSVMGAGEGPDGVTMYKQNRATLHLHGGKTVWISDGTPHQWITPAGEDTPYPKGVSVKNVPDMPDPGDGSMTFFYSNEQSARMLWYHDHALGITRLNVMAGEAAGYLLTDDTEKKLVEDHIIPEEQIPLIVQDKTFVDTATIRVTDPTWNWGTGALDASTGVRAPKAGDLWVPHVYVPAQNPADPGGMNATGRWHYGPWFWPPVLNISNPPIPNPYYDPINTPWEPALMPATPNPSMGMENYNDTPLVNGTPYPTLSVKPKAYRFRILNAANDRFFNLQMYVADPLVLTSDRRRNTEVKMVPATPNRAWPELWPTDGRVGGVPDPRTVGPQWIQIGTESGFLPAPAIIPNQPITWNTDPTTFNMGNVQDHSLLLGNAERADVIVDFSKYAGKTIILYNDAPTAFPALDQRTDYFTGGPDLTATGGTKSTKPGFGPNTRTIMQITVAAAPAARAFDLQKLQEAFSTSSSRDGVFKRSQAPIIVPDSRYDSAYNGSFAVDPFVRIYGTTIPFKTLAGEDVTIPLGAKAIQDEQGETFDPMYGRMSAKLGLERPSGVPGAPNFMLYSYFDPTTETLEDSMTPLTPVGADGTQIWKITHNGVDTHPVHFHLFDVQVINRVGWDNAVRLPDDNELGWKDTVRISPLEDTIVALRPHAPNSPFGVYDSVRPLNPAASIGATMGFSIVDPVTGVNRTTPVTNQLVNFGWEYVWHCHILSHEEMDMMRPMSLNVDRRLSISPALSASGTPGAPVALSWIDPTPASDPANWGNPAGEVEFIVERATTTSDGVESTYTPVGKTLANETAFTDSTTLVDTAYVYRVIARNAAGDTSSNSVRIAPAGFFAAYNVFPWSTVGGTIVPDTTQSVPAGTDSTSFTITAATDHHLVDVRVDGASVGTVGEYKFPGVDRDHTIAALFAADMVTITPTIGDHGLIDPTVPTGYVVGSDVTVTIQPDVGYRVADVRVDGVSVGAVSTYAFTNMRTNHTIAATFVLQQFQIVPTAGPNGSITPAVTQTVPYGGNSGVFKITAAPGYYVADVLVNGVSVGPRSTYQFIDIRGPHTITSVNAPMIATAVSLSRSASSIRRGRTVRLSGRVSPVALAGQTVRIDVRRPGSRSWRVLSYRRISTSAGRAVWWPYTYRLTSRGLYSFRVSYLGDRTHRRSVSSTAYVRAR
ncbi:MAG: multicopper oxidase domain-containing protein [Coriobacteriia bacterium]|nr:multicopper oxidase domain-containing protein [Coriobacteriia bacterium]